jgi:hypothetical protein
LCCWIGREFTCLMFYRNLLQIQQNTNDLDNELTLCSCDVDIDDLIDFAVAWLSSDADADFNDSGRADFVDFAVLAEDWLAGTDSL